MANICLNNSLTFLRRYFSCSAFVVGLQETVEVFFFLMVFDGSKVFLSAFLHVFVLFLGDVSFCYAILRLYSCKAFLNGFRVWFASVAPQVMTKMQSLMTSTIYEDRQLLCKTDLSLSYFECFTMQTNC